MRGRDRRSSLCSAVFLTATCALSCSSERVDPAPQRATYEVDRTWPSLPAGTLLGQVSGVGIDSHGNPLVFRRAERDWFGGPTSLTPIDEPTILGFDAMSGALDIQLAQNQFAMPHGLTVDSHDHLWVTDVALQQVFELDNLGNVLRSFGEAGVAGNDDSHFSLPTDVAVASDGSIFVSDGYGNARVIELAADGSFVRSFGEPGSLPGQFSTPHGISIGPDQNLYVADRGNARVQIFNQQGVLQGIWESRDLGRPWAITFDNRGRAFVVDGGDQKLPNRSRILQVDSSGNVVTSFGSYGAAPGEMIQPHDIAVDNLGAVYVVEVATGRRAQKFVPTY